MLYDTDLKTKSKYYLRCSMFSNQNSLQKYAEMLCEKCYRKIASEASHSAPIMYDIFRILGSITIDKVGSL